MELKKIDEKIRSFVEFSWFLAAHILYRFLWISIRNKSNSSFSMIIDFNLNQSSYVVQVFNKPSGILCQSQNQKVSGSNLTNLPGWNL